jgi:hypothetical protein
MDITKAATEPILAKFYRQYLQVIADVTYPPGPLLVKQDVQDCLYKYFFDASRNKFLPPARYQTRILKNIIQEIEKACKDPEEDVGIDSKQRFVLPPLPSPLCKKPPSANSPR